MHQENRLEHCFEGRRNGWPQKIYHTALVPRVLSLRNRLSVQGTIIAVKHLAS
jgi:hypothetical protein